MNAAAYIKTKIDILTVVGSYLSLTRKSSTNHVGLCPFHQDKSPSLSVNPANGYYKCWACDAKGDLLDFVSRIESCGFLDACKILIERFSIPPPIRVYKSAVRREIKALEAAGRRAEAIEMVGKLRT